MKDVSKKLWGFLKEYGDIKLLRFVRVMPDFKAVVFSEGQLPLTVATPSAVNSAFDRQC
jgi:hypothetical protein